ncbi:hypothetical protein GCM10023063_18830 [Arthrobacter methylotrophus]|uniref:SHOCT domain-containing protein n=1 Tax=Arthrobacter methylotrophus TaxID=121291 RepID=A0ABV5UP38_9MICC
MFNRKRTPYRADIEAAIPAYREAASNIERSEIASLESRLEPGETVLFLSGYRVLPLIVLTDRRVRLFSDGRLKADVSYRLADIDNANWGPSTLSMIVAGTRASIPNFPRQHRTRLMAAFEPAWRAARNQSYEPVPADSDIISQLERLAALRDAGVVTKDEFEAKKVEMLARL